MTRSRTTAPPLGVPVVDIGTARARLDADKAARQARHIAESIAAREAKRESAAATCANPDALADSLRLTIVLRSGPLCPVCGSAWTEHDRPDLRAHLDAVLGAPTNSPGAA